MEENPFGLKEKLPSKGDLKTALNSTYSLWLEIEEFCILNYPKALCEWKHSGQKYGWSYRIKDKKRVIAYFLPRLNYFKIALVFGKKAVEEVLNSSVSDEIKTELAEAKVYAEGRGIRIDVKSVDVLMDVKALIHIKLKN